MNFTRIHDEMAAMRLDLERGIRKLEELFPTKPAASTTPTPTASTPTTAPPTTTPTAAARTMEEEARIHNKLDRCIQMLRETRMGMESLSSSASSTTSDISTTASSTTLPPPPPTTRELPQALPTRCSTPSPCRAKQALKLVNAATTIASISSSTPTAASTSPQPATAALSTPTQTRAAVCAGQEVFTTTPAKCSTYCLSNDVSMVLAPSSTLPLDTSVSAAAPAPWVPAATICPLDNSKGLSLQSTPIRYINNSTTTHSVGVPNTYPASKAHVAQNMEEIVLLNPILLQPLLVTLVDRGPEPNILNVEIAGILPKPPWPVIPLRANDLMSNIDLQLCFSSCMWFNCDGVTWRHRSIPRPSFKFSVSVQMKEPCPPPPTPLALVPESCVQFPEMCDCFSIYFVHSSSPELQSWSCAVGKQLQVSVIQWSIAWRFSIDERIFGFTNLVQEPANVLWVTSINLGSLTTIVRKHVTVQWRCGNTKLKGHMFTVGVQVRMLSDVERTTLATVCLSLLLVWCCHSEVQYHVPFPFQVCTSLLIEMNGNRLLKYWVVISWQRSWECFSSSLARSISPGLQYFGYALGKPSQPCNMLQAPPIINEFVIAQLKRGGSRAGIARSSKCQNELAANEISGMRNGFQYLLNTVQMQQHSSFWLSTGVTDYQQVILCNPELGLHTAPHVSDRRRILNLACCSSKHMLLCVTVSLLFQNNVTFLSQRAWQIPWSVSMDASSQKLLLPYQHGHEVAFLLSLLMKLSGPITLHSHIFTNGISIKLLSEVGNTIHIKLCSSLLFPWCNDVWNQRELHESFKYQCDLEAVVGSIGCNEFVGGQARLKFVLQPEEARHGADTGCKMGLHRMYIMKINYKVQVIWVLLFYSQAIEDP